jgi:hypothetical protein
LDLSNTGFIDNSSFVLERWLVQSDISGIKLIMGLAATELPDVHCALWPNFEISEILNF